jgi:sugar phosphate isomerase/epimerase
MGNMYPKIYLAIDNCVLYKRYTSPDEWAKIIKDLGIDYVEASADTELDPLYMGSDYLNDWVDQVIEAQNRYRVKVCNLYSGHGTYTTLGLTHTDQRVRERMIEKWFFPMVRTAGALGCGIGFFAHAFKNMILQSGDLYRKYIDILVEALVRINQYADEVNCGKLGIEQMYTPHQYPWRIKDTRDLLSKVTQKSGRNFYFTEDVGHHHVKFMRPDKKNLQFREIHGVWLGTDKAFEIAQKQGMVAWDKIETEINNNPHLFSEKQDGDCYEIIRQLGCYSPIVHLQQTNGMISAHLPFTQDENQKGKINGGDLLRALMRSYEQANDKEMPAKSNEIYLTLELFSGTTSIMHDVLKDCRESVDYWRRFVPEDGLGLDVLIRNLER